MMTNAAISSYNHWQISPVTTGNNRKALAVFLINLGLLQLPVETRKSNTFNQCQSDSVKQLLVGQRVLESDKWILDN